MNTPLALIIEDDQDAATICYESLKAAGFVCEVIKTGDAGLARLKEVVPTVVVLDMHLPNVAGPDILRYIQREARLARTQVIIATADPRIADELREEATLTLLKPISFTQLRDMARRLKEHAEKAEQPDE